MREDQSETAEQTKGGSPQDQTAEEVRASGEPQANHLMRAFLELLYTSKALNERCSAQSVRAIPERKRAARTSPSS